MRIAYIINVCTNKYNGIRVQAETWADELIRQGHDLVKVNPWERIEWEQFDIVHIIGADRAIDGLFMSLSKYCKKIVFSPIIDTIEPIWRYRIATHVGCKRLRLYSLNYALRQSKPYIDRWFVRSHYEFAYVNKAYGVPVERISIIPLSFRTPVCDEYPKKEYFCFHVSMLTDNRKNVIRLMKAAVKYKFDLVLAGSIRSEKDFEPLRQIIEKNENITYLGRISDDELVALYKRAKVFALPSINEGVGLVAVEAASYGCDIVVTKIGGPKEYYDGMAYIINPYDIDDIGKSVISALQETQFQPILQKHILKMFNLHRCVEKLVNEYKR